MKVIGSVRRYLGTSHDGLCGVRVVIISVHRGGDDGEILRDDVAIGAVQPHDIVEFAPIIVEDGRERTSWVASDAMPWEFEPPLCRRPDARS
jgi:hypothetical protein